jgi:hypothetical protein
MTGGPLTLAKIEDREGDGTCSACDREGLRWVAILSDGTGVGLECAKKILGFKPAPGSYAWVADFRPSAEHRDHAVIYVLWQHKRGNATRETRNGHLTEIGGVRNTWIRRGWLAIALAGLVR